jgi:hypothetical protein
MSRKPQCAKSAKTCYPHSLLMQNAEWQKCFFFPPLLLLLFALFAFVFIISLLLSLTAMIMVFESIC